MDIKKVCLSNMHSSEILFEVKIGVNLLWKLEVRIFSKVEVSKIRMNPFKRCEQIKEISIHTGSKLNHKANILISL